MPSPDRLRPLSRRDFLKIITAAGVTLLAGSARPAGGDVSASTTPATPISILSGDTKQPDNPKNLSKEAEKMTIAEETERYLEGVRKFIATRGKEFTGTFGVYMEPPGGNAIVLQGLDFHDQATLDAIDTSLAALKPLTKNPKAAIPVQIDLQYGQSGKNDLTWDVSFTTYGGVDTPDYGRKSWIEANITAKPGSGNEATGNPDGITRLAYLFNQPEFTGFMKGAAPQQLMEPLVNGPGQEPYILPTAAAVADFNQILLSGFPDFLQAQVPSAKAWDTRVPGGPSLYK